MEQIQVSDGTTEEDLNRIESIYYLDLFKTRMEANGEVLYADIKIKKAKKHANGDFILENGSLYSLANLRFIQIPTDIIRQEIYKKYLRDPFMACPTIQLANEKIEVRENELFYLLCYKDDRPNIYQMLIEINKKLFKGYLR